MTMSCYVKYLKFYNKYFIMTSALISFSFSFHFYRLAMPDFTITRSAIYHNTARTLCDRLGRSDQVSEHHKGGIN